VVSDPAVVAEVMGSLGVPWAIAGGWAIDLWLGTTTRGHHDVEVVVARQDQRRIHAALRPEWQLERIDPPSSGWRSWADDTEMISPPSFQAKARSSTIEFDLFMENVEDGTWFFRRDDRIRRSWDDVLTRARSGLPVVAPEVQLLYMAKSTEPKNEHDFEVARCVLTVDAAIWLSECLAVAYPDHRWRLVLPSTGA
jgi:hypothetical protein